MSIKILAADDDKAMISLYLRIFSGTDYSVSTALTFEEASGLLRSEDYDLLITDYMFPDGLGTGLIKLFKEVKKGAKSLIVTGSPYAKEKILAEGAEVLLEKPFKMDQLLAEVAKVIG